MKSCDLSTDPFDRFRLNDLFLYILGDYGHNAFNLEQGVHTHTHIHTSGAHVHAALPGDKVVAAATAARVHELFTHPALGVVVVASDGGRAPALVHRIQAEHRDSCCRERVRNVSLDHL